jgi:ATP-dependent DNA helicase RecG
MIIDDKIVQASLFAALEETMPFVITHLKVAFKITGKAIE